MLVKHGCRIVDTSKKRLTTSRAGTVALDDPGAQEHAPRQFPGYRGCPAPRAAPRSRGPSRRVGGGRQGSHRRRVRLAALFLRLALVGREVDGLCPIRSRRPQSSGARRALHLSGDMAVRAAHARAALSMLWLAGSVPRLFRLFKQRTESAVERQVVLFRRPFVNRFDPQTRPAPLGPQGSAQHRRTWQIAPTLARLRAHKGRFA